MMDIGTKKVQQALSAPGNLERFVHHPDEVIVKDHIAKLKNVFAGLYSLDPPTADQSRIEYERIVNMAIDNPHRFVLKPQREGGGNNFYGDELAHQLRSLTSKELSAYILMERILPPQQNAHLVRDGNYLDVSHA